MQPTQREKRLIASPAAAYLLAAVGCGLHHCARAASGQAPEELMTRVTSSGKAA